MKIINLKPLVLLACAMIILFRVPGLIFTPRFYAEEGTLYFSTAYYFSNSFDWYKGLTQIQVGYFSIWPNLANTIAANIVKLDQAPIIVTIFSFIIQILPITIFLWGDSEFWDTNIQKIICILIYLFVPISTELWLNTITNQFIFGLITFLILHSKANQLPSFKWLFRILLLIGGLTGIVSCLLLPFYILMAFVEKKKERIIQTSIIGLTTFIQLIIVFLNISQRGGISSSLFQNLLLAPFTQSTGLLIFNYASTTKIYELYKFLMVENKPLLYLMIIVVAILHFLFLYIVYKKLPVKHIYKITLSGSYLVVLYFSLIGSLNYEYIRPGYGHRYFYTPNIILAISIFLNIDFRNGLTNMFNSNRNKIFIILTALPLVWGSIKFLNARSIDNAFCPKWKDELKKWEKNNNYQINTCPSDFGKIILRKK
jgi:hypothetical protein